MIFYCEMCVLVDGRPEHIALLQHEDGTIAQLLAGEHGFEPWNGGFKGPCLTTWRLPNVHQYYHFSTGHALVDGAYYGS